MVLLHRILLPDVSIMAHSCGIIIHHLHDMSRTPCPFSLTPRSSQRLPFSPA